MIYKVLSTLKRGKLYKAGDTIELEANDAKDLVIDGVLDLIANPISKPKEIKTEPEPEIKTEPEPEIKTEQTRKGGRRKRNN